MILPLLLVLFLATFTHGDEVSPDMSPRVSPACHDKKIHEFPITLKEVTAVWYYIGSAYELESYHEFDKKSTYGVMKIYVIEGKTKLTYWNGVFGNLEVSPNENSSLVQHGDHVLSEEPRLNISWHMRKVSDDCIKLALFNHTYSSHAIGDFLFCRSHRGNDADIEAFKQRSRCRNFNHISVRRYDFEYASKCHSVAHHLDPLDVKSILGVWHLEAKAGKDDTIMKFEENLWAEFIMDGESLKIQGGYGSIKLSNEATVNGSKILLKHGNTSFALSFYPTCKDCLLMRHEDESGGNVNLHLFKRLGKLTAEEVEKFKDNVRCLSLPMANVRQDIHTPEQKEEPEKSHSKVSTGENHPN